MELLEKDGPSRLFDELRKNLESGHQKILVEGPPGSGRGVLLALLQKELSSRAVVVAPPPLDDADAVIHALMQMASSLDRSVQDRIQRDEEPLDQRAAYVARTLEAAKKILLLRLPGSWRFTGEAEDSPDIIVRRERALGALEALARQPRLTILITAAHDTGLDRQFQFFSKKSLNLAPVNEEAIKDLSPWGKYASAAEYVRDRCFPKRVRATPLQFRIAVALRALGVPAEQLARMLEHSGYILPALQNRLIKVLATRSDLMESVFRFALVRWPLPREEIIRISKIEDDHVPLITECLSGGSDAIVLHEWLRDSILAVGKSGSFRGMMSEIEPPTHSALASYHARQDGTRHAAASKSVVDWLERAHHLAGAGPGESAAWADLDLRCREFYWDRGRALSLQDHYELAAAVYRDCLKKFGSKDAYAQHYLGFNLDRAGKCRDEAEQALRQAVELDPPNPWWNARLVTFLIGQARFVAARSQWLAALAGVDPTGDVVQRSPWLARHMHRWVVAEWLDHGEVELAREAFESIPRQIVEKDMYLSRLADRLADAEEAQALGDTVYPRYISPEERWKGPRLVPETCANGSPLRAWYPGRVLQATDDTVSLVFAITNFEPQERRVMTRELDADSWKRATNRPPASAKGFVEIGSYEDGTLIIEMLDARRAEWDRPERPDILRYLTRWERESDADANTA